MIQNAVRTSATRVPTAGRAGGVWLAALLIGFSGWNVRNAEAQRPDPTGLYALQRDFIHIAEKLSPSVVRVASRFTGVIVDGRGYVLSDLAAVSKTSQSIGRIPVELASGRVVDATVVHRSRRSRTALLKIVKGGRYPNIPAGDSDELQVGDLAITIGNAFNQAQRGGQPAVTVGHVAGLWPASADHQGIKVGRIVTTAAINPGTSGGPLIDVRGSLIGINDQRRDTGDMGQVMPINFIRESYASNEEAYRVLSLGAQKRGRPRTFANYMDQSVIHAARQACRAVVSLRITRADPADKATPEKTGERKGTSPGSAEKPEKTAPKADPNPDEKPAPPPGEKPATPPEKKPSGPPSKPGDQSKPKQDGPPDKPAPGAAPSPPAKERRDGVVPLKLPSPPRSQPRRQRPRKRPTFKLKRREDPVSGVIVSPDGLILTATANLWETPKKKIDRIEVILDDGRVVEARRLGTDHMRGLTLLRVPAAGLPVLKETQPGDPPVGSFVAVLGNPYGTGRFRRETFLTWGVLSARNQLDPTKAALQTDAWVNQANQGGALIDLEGRLLGITLLVRPSRYGINSGVGFAIPVASARQALPRLEKGEDVHPGYLGVRLPPVYEPEIRGARIVEVVKLSPAEKAGLQPGDCILSVNGRITMDMRAVLLALSGVCEGQQVELEVQRNSVPRIVRVVAGRRG